MLILSCENEFYLHENEKRFPYQKLSTYPRFETEAPGELSPGNGLFWYRIWKLSGAVNPLVLKRSVVNLGRNIGRLPFTTVTLPFKKDIVHFSIPVLHSRH